MTSYINIKINFLNTFCFVFLGIGSLKNLKILSLGRNLIKGFAGLEALGDTLVEVWISYNYIEKMKGIQAMKNLRVLYMSNNLVREWNEFARLQELPNLQDLVFVGNPLYESHEVLLINILIFFNTYRKTKFSHIQRHL